MSDHGPIRILIADDFPVVRQGLKMILTETLKGSVIGEASNSREVLKLIRQEKWDLLVLDICMPGRSGLEALREIKAIRPGLPVLVLSMYPEDQFAERSILCGADGYLNKEEAPDELVAAVNKVLRGGKYISRSWAEQLVLRLKPGWNKLPHERLSDREYEIMLLTSSGKTLREIAAELSLSIKTVSTYRTRTLQKLGMKTNAELIRYTIYAQLTSDPARPCAEPTNLASEFTPANEVNRNGIHLVHLSKSK